MSPSLRKLGLSLHVLVSVGWIGAAGMYLMLATAAIWSDNPQTWRQTWGSLELLGWYGLVPMAGIALATGLIMALGTSWGLVRHYWVLVSFLLTVVATAILLRHMFVVSEVAQRALALDTGQDISLRRAFRSEILHAGLGVILLAVIEVLNVYKPRGLTPFALRHPSAVAQPAIAETRAAVPVGQRPFWLRVVIGHAIAIAVLIALFHVAGGAFRH